MLTKFKVQAAIVAGVACLSLSAAASWGSTEADHAAKPQAHPRASRSRSSNCLIG